MHNYTQQLWLTGSIILLCLANTSITQAQIAPDNTLGTENSIVTPNVNINGFLSDQIDGGAMRESNLFHSFREFNVGEDTRVYFTNPTGVTNILSRVTGGNASNIFGRLGVLGNANLFLINPSGIIFGSNARLDVRGSFLASTASSLNFADGNQFSATNPQTPPLLIVSTPIGLQFGGSQSKITLERLDEIRQPDLRVQPEQTLALVGGDITLNSASLVAPGGRIELGSVAGSGLVSLTPAGSAWTLGYESVQSFSDIHMSQETFVDVSSDSSGDVQLQGRNITLTDGSRILASNNQGSQGGGTLAVTASESVELIGTGSRDSSGLFVEVMREALGTGGNLRIDTRRLIIQDGAQAAAFTSGIGDAGDLTIRAASVELDGNSVPASSPTGLFATAEKTSTGVGGNLRIDTGQLIVRGGAQVSASASGKNNAGDLTVQATDLVEISGDDSRLLAQVNSSSQGDGGNLSIITGRLIVQNGGQVSASTFSTGDAGSLSVQAFESVELTGRTTNGELPSGLFAGTDVQTQGNGGDLTIQTRRLIVQGGAQAQVSTLGAGDAGRLTVQASESVELTGTGLIRTGPRSGELFPSSLLAVSGLAGVFTEAQGKGGDLRIETGQLILQDGARVTVSSTSTASDAKGAGNVDVTAQTIRLDNQAGITAETASGDGGNILLENPDLLLLRRRSNISTNAGTAGVGGTGGNIAINNAQFIVAASDENSDIKANAFLGQGGQVSINTVSIFGLVQRNLQDLQALLTTNDPKQLDPINLTTSDITAISQTDPSLGGQVTINTPDADPSRGLVALPTNFIDASGLIAQSCRGGGRATANEQSQFIVTGRGGLPPSPSDALSTQAVWQDLRSLRQVANQSSSESSSELDVKRTSQSSFPIVEAQGWVIDSKGQVILTAQAPNVTPYASGLTPVSCQ